MRKLHYAYTATCGILFPHMRHNAEIHPFSRTALWPIYTSLCGKSQAHMRQHAVFNIIHHTALYYCCKTTIRYCARK